MSYIYTSGFDSNGDPFIVNRWRRTTWQRVCRHNVGHAVYRGPLRIRNLLGPNTNPFPLAILFPGRMNTQGTSLERFHYSPLFIHRKYFRLLDTSSALGTIEPETFYLPSPSKIQLSSVPACSLAPINTVTLHGQSTTITAVVYTA
jgi:hypothetical protein